MRRILLPSCIWAALLALAGSLYPVLHLALESHADHAAATCATCESLACARDAIHPEAGPAAAPLQARCGSAPSVAVSAPYFFPHTVARPRGPPFG